MDKKAQLIKSGVWWGGARKPNGAIIWVRGNKNGGVEGKGEDSLAEGSKRREAPRAGEAMSPHAAGGGG